MSRDKVRCPYCPRTLDRAEYAEHWDKFHNVNLVTGSRHAWREPLEITGRPARQTTKINDDAPLWEDEG